MKRALSVYNRIREVAKRLTPGWINRYGGGDEGKAAMRLANKYGFANQETYMLALVEIVREYPSEAAFQAGVEEFHSQGQRMLVSELSDCEVDVSDDFKTGTDQDAVFVRQCYMKAYYYAARHAHRGAVLVHGIIEDDVLHAWVELPGKIVFDGVTQRFYCKDRYYAKRLAMPLMRYDHETARMMLLRNRNHGPWD